MRVVRLITALVNKVSEWVGRITSDLLVLPMVLILCWEVVLRYAFNSPTIWAHELSTFLFGAIFMLGSAFALLHGAHVRMDGLYRLFPPRMKAIVDLLTSVLFYSVCIVLVWKGGEAALLSIKGAERSMTIWEPPLWPIKLAIPIGGILLLFQGLVVTIGNVYTAVTSRELNTKNNRQGV